MAQVSESGSNVNEPHIRPHVHRGRAVGQRPISELAKAYLAPTLSNAVGRPVRTCDSHLRQVERTPRPRATGCDLGVQPRPRQSLIIDRRFDLRLAGGVGRERGVA
jgi:hypothetical protein